MRDQNCKNVFTGQSSIGKLKRRKNYAHVSMRDQKKGRSRREKWKSINRCIRGKRHYSCFTDENTIDLFYFRKSHNAHTQRNVNTHATNALAYAINVVYVTQWERCINVSRRRALNQNLRKRVSVNYRDYRCFYLVINLIKYYVRYKIQIQEEHADYICKYFKCNRMYHLKRINWYATLIRNSI